MPGTPDCIFSSGHVEEQNENENRIMLQLINKPWESEKYYDTTDFNSVSIDWGDGSPIETISLEEEVNGNDHWRSHTYDSSDNHIIFIEYVDENLNTFSHHFTYRGEMVSNQTIIMMKTKIQMMETKIQMMRNGMNGT